MTVAPHSAARALLVLPSEPDRVGHDWLGTLAEVPLFEGLSKRHLRRIAKLARIRRFADGAAMVRVGDAGRTFYVLLDGNAKVNRPGRRSVRLGPGAFFGEMSLIDDSPRSADVVAEGDVLALTIDRPGFTKLLRAEPALSQALLRTMAARLRAAEAAD
ncbi:MAG TPA: cyclic nucleotide-binding domain-containing protein [Gaiellaceae bacterium]|nr:cyclic nucleotide-binding domain-containing protein [Gaiellaceae bacterium]